MSRTRDAGLAIGLLVAVVLIGLLKDATVVPATLLAGAVATAVAEAIAYRGPAWIRAQFERSGVVAGAFAFGIGGIVVGAILAPDRSLSVAVGALLAYLLLLAITGAVGLAPSGDRCGSM